MWKWSIVVVCSEFFTEILCCAVHCTVLSLNTVTVFWKEEGAVWWTNQRSDTIPLPRILINKDPNKEGGGGEGGGRSKNVLAFSRFLQPRPGRSRLWSKNKGGARNPRPLPWICLWTAIKFVFLKLGFNGRFTYFCFLLLEGSCV